MDSVYVLLLVSTDREEGSAVENNELVILQPGVTSRNEDSQDATMVSMKQPRTIDKASPSHVIMVEWLVFPLHIVHMLPVQNKTAFFTNLYPFRVSMLSLPVYVCVHA